MIHELMSETVEDMRRKLLDEAADFVQSARQIPGATRIARIGSLTTDKVDPKDADLSYSGNQVPMFLSTARR
jgi:hypothetical protein